MCVPSIASPRAMMGGCLANCRYLILPHLVAKTVKNLLAMGETWV